MNRGHHDVAGMRGRGTTHSDAALARQEGVEWLPTFLLCGFFGVLGIHRFYTGHRWIGVVQGLTCGGCLLWNLVDLVMILTDTYRDSEGRPLVRR